MNNDADFKRRLAKLKLRALALEFTELRIQAEYCQWSTSRPNNVI